MSPEKRENGNGLMEISESVEKKLLGIDRMTFGFLKYCKLVYIAYQCIRSERKEEVPFEKDFEESGTTGPVAFEL